MDGGVFVLPVDRLGKLASRRLLDQISCRADRSIAIDETGEEGIGMIVVHWKDPTVTIFQKPLQTAGALLA